jgi:hypothetical protein
MLSPDLPRGRGKLIGADLAIDDECSEQNFEPFTTGKLGTFLSYFIFLGTEEYN